MVYKILIVDDEFNIVILFEFLMKKEGFEIVIVNDGEDVLVKVVSFKLDLLLLDVMMLKKLGFEVCEVLCVDLVMVGLLIVMLIVKGCDMEVVKGLVIGVDVYVIKLFLIKDLVVKVKSMFGVV